MSGRVEGRGEVFGVRSERSIVEQIREKLEAHNNNRFQRMGSSSSVDYNSYPVNDKEGETGGEGLQDWGEIEIPPISNRLQRDSTKRVLVEAETKKESENNFPVLTADFNPSKGGKGRNEVDKLLKNENAGRSRGGKKILKRSSKIEIESPALQNYSDPTEHKIEGKHQNLIRDDKTINSPSRITKSKPILKRSDHFEISVDKNSILRSSSDVKKVLHKEMNIRGKLLNLPAYNDISFDASFKPVHR